MQVVADNTLWDRCMWVLIKKRKDEGATELNLADVDALVLEKAHIPINELLEFIGAPNAK